MKGIETAQSLTDDEGNACSFDAESKKLQKTVDEMTKYHGEILAIFEKISTAPAERRIKYIDMTKGYMKAIEKKTREHGASMETSAARLKEALHSTVPLEKLDQKLEGLMLKFLQREHRKKHKIDSDKVDQNQTVDFMHRSLKQE